MLLSPFPCCEHVQWSTIGAAARLPSDAPASIEIQVRPLSGRSVFEWQGFMGRSRCVLCTCVRSLWWLWQCTCRRHVSLPHTMTFSGGRPPGRCVPRHGRASTALGLVWCGRRALTAAPPNILLTTPQTSAAELEDNLREVLRSVDAVQPAQVRHGVLGTRLSCWQLCDPTGPPPPPPHRRGRAAGCGRHIVLLLLPPIRPGSSRHRTPCGASAFVR